MAKNTINTVVIVIAITIVGFFLIFNRDFNKEQCYQCEAYISADATFCPQCGAKINLGETGRNPLESIPSYGSSISSGSNTSSKIENGPVWTNCPIDITGGISGSSNSEIIKLNIKNITLKDIDSVKVLVAFTHTGYDNSTEYITGFYTTDTIWANESIKATISGGSYNFLRAQIFPVCVYFKNGDVWGDSSASYTEITTYSRSFYIEHYAFS